MWLAKFVRKPGASHASAPSDVGRAVAPAVPLWCLVAWALVALTAMPAHAQSYLPGSDEWGSKGYPRQLQRYLNQLGCYSGPIDGKFGTGSINALNAFLAVRSLPANSNSRSGLQDFLKNSTGTVCTGASTTAVAGTCDKLDAEAQWLKQRPEIGALKSSLAALSTKFDQLIAAQDDRVEISEAENIPCLTAESGGKCDDKVKSKDLFLAAKLRLDALIEASAVKGNSTCERCVVIARWSSLKRIAEPNNGILRSMDLRIFPPKVDATVPALDVNDIDEGYVIKGEGNFVNVRNLVALLKTDPLRATEIGVQLQREVNAIVKNYPKYKEGIAGKTVYALAGVSKNYRCIGFDSIANE